MSIHSFSQSNYVSQLIPLATQGTINSAYVAPFATSGTSGDATKAVFLVWVGTIGVGVTLTAKLRQATTSGGANVKDIAASTLTVFGETSDERIRSIEVHPSALDDANGFKYIQLVVTAVGGTAIWGAFQINHGLRNAGFYDQAATYDQQLELPY